MIHIVGYIEVAIVLFLLILEPRLDYYNEMVMGLHLLP